MNYLDTESREVATGAVEYMIFEQNGQKFAVCTNVAEEAKEDGIDGYAIKSTIKSNKYFAGIENAKMTEAQAAEALTAAIARI